MAKKKKGGPLSWWASMLQPVKKETQMKLDLAILAGAESKAWLADLMKVADRLEKVAAKLEVSSTVSELKSTKGAPHVADALSDFSDDNRLVSESPATTPKKTSKKAAVAKPAVVESFEEEDEDGSESSPTDASTDDDDEDDDFGSASTKKASAKVSNFDDEEEDEDELPVVVKKGKKTAPKKVTFDEVNDACKKRANAAPQGLGRDQVLSILNKKFGVTSVSKLLPEQYVDVVKAMAVSQ
jgi:hypothetical protein